MMRLLGGSHHGKKIDWANNRTLYMRKKPKRIQWVPQNTEWGQEPFTIEEEIYELQTFRKVTPINDYQFKVESKTAYVKRGSKVKPETFWKLALKYEVETVWKNFVSS